MILLRNIIFIFLWHKVQSCGNVLSGSSSNSASFSISFLPPVGYTYPPDGIEAIQGQAVTLTIAEQTITKDINLAISNALKENQIYLAAPPNVSYVFTPPEVEVSSGSSCSVGGECLELKGTIFYQCVEQDDEQPTTTTKKPAGKRRKQQKSGHKEKREVGVGEESTSSSVATTEPTTVSSTTSEAPTTTTSANGTIGTTSIGSSETTTAKNPATTSGSSSKLKTKPFIQKMTVTANAQTSLFESQWTSIAKSVQATLEKQNLIFDGDIIVNIV